MTLDPAIDAALRLAFVLLFVGAAVHKLRDLAGFRAALAAYELVPRTAARAVSAVVVAVELGIGAGLVVPALARVAAPLGMALLGVYALAIGVNLARGRGEIRCGCGGAGGERPIAPALVLRNIALAALLGLTLLPGTSREFAWLDLATVALAVTTAAVLYVAIDVAIANAGPLRRLAAGRPARATGRTA